MVTFLLLCLLLPGWLVLGILVAWSCDVRARYQLSYTLQRHLPGPLPQVLMALFWPATLAWALMRR